MKRQVTLRSPAQLDGADGDTPGVSSPLLAHGRRKREVGKFRSIRHECRVLLGSAWAFATSKTGQGVLKCSLAYLLGSMATFVPVISDYLGQQDGKHMVATVTVYFHPARSQGSMFEGALLAVLAFIYAAFISFTSMGVSILFDQTYDLLIVGHVVVLVVFCGGGLGFVGWVKQRLGNPLVNVACSLTSLAIITVLTKEGSVQAAEFSEDKVVQVMKMILMGVVAAMAVCFLVRPVSARNELRENMIKVTDSFGDMLAMITRSFLTGSAEELEQKQFLTASDRYRTVFSSLAKNLREAKFEHYVLGTEAEARLEVKLVNCMRRMAHSIGGLRSAASTQFDLLAHAPAYGSATPNAPISSPSIGPYIMAASTWSTIEESRGTLTAIDEHPEEDETSTDPPDKPDEPRNDAADEYGELPTVRSPVDIFDRFIAHLGPSMVRLIPKGSAIIANDRHRNPSLIRSSRSWTSCPTVLHLTIRSL